MDELTVRCKQLFEKLYGTDKLNVFSENIEKIFIRCKEWRENTHRTEECSLAELKVLFNNEIMENCSDDVIKRYFQKIEQREDSQEEFRTIIRETYGEKAEKILRERNNLNVYNINSLEIFSSPILQNFSLEFVNDLISYHIMGFSNFLGIVKNPQRLKNFKLYYDLLSNIMGENVETMQRTIMQFDYIEELLNNVEEENLSEIQYKNLISVLCSLGNLSDIMDAKILENNSDKTTSSIYKEIDDNGLEHYYLNGLPFAFISTQLSLSSGYENDASLTVEKIKRFLEYDGQRGASTISCSFVKRRD